MFWKKNISEHNDGISSEILPSFRSEAVKDRDVILNQIQVSYVKFPHLRNVQMLFLWLKSVYLMPNKWFEVWQSMFKHPVEASTAYRVLVYLEGSQKTQNNNKHLQ